MELLLKSTMIMIGLLLIYLAIARKMEPTLLLPMGFGAILVNLPDSVIAGSNGILTWLYSFGIETYEVFPLLLFIGIGAMIDFTPLMERPWLIFIGAAGQGGIFITLVLASLFFPLNDAASIAIIGAADGPTAIMVSERLGSQFMAPILIAAYCYMALVPIIQPAVLKACTTKKERLIRMHYSPSSVSKSVKIAFPIAVTAVCSLIAPESAALVGMLMFGNLVKESGVLDSLSGAAQNVLSPLISLLLGLAIAPMMRADSLLRLDTLMIIAFGLFAFVFDTACGVAFVKLVNLFLPQEKKVNPLIGGAGISAFPMSSRVIQKLGNEEDRQNHLLPFALGANVAGQIGSVLAGGIILSMFM
ncbi:MAG: sodium ion-translocating decarboxylase subunit beta [Candidatus Ornithospirochaeta sp.]|nr:sodium ion-translocating decarboxylase subunit beta [Candidatus Ornithospirochaeta sp.]